MNDKEIMAKLGKVYGELNSLDSLPKKGCTTIIQDAKLTVHEVITEMSQNKRGFPWIEVVKLILMVDKLWKWLKDYFNFCNLFNIKYKISLLFQIIY